MSTLNEVPASAKNFIGLLVVIGSIIAIPVFVSVAMFVVVLAIIGMVILHELGHYVVARATGMKVTEFYVGFGPRVWSVKRGETTFGVRMLLLGAYVRIPGMSSKEQVAPEEEHRSYRAQPFWQRVAVIFAGSGMHFILALGLIFSFLVLVGKVDVQDSTNWTIETVASGSPADIAGLESGDRIVEMNGTPVQTWEAFLALLPAPGTRSTWTIEREGEKRSVTITPAGNPYNNRVSYVGVSTIDSVEYVATDVNVLQSVGYTFTDFGYFTKESALGIIRVFSPTHLTSFFKKIFYEESDSSTDLAGTASPDERIVSIFGAVKLGEEIAEQDIRDLLLFLALINVFIGVFNLVPLLPFDGGHIAIAVYERLRSRRGERYMVNIKKVEPLAYLVVIILLTIGIGAIYLDIVDPVILE